MPRAAAPPRAPAQAAANKKRAVCGQDQPVEMQKQAAARLRAAAVATPQRRGAARRPREARGGEEAGPPAKKGAGAAAEEPQVTAGAESDAAVEVALRLHADLLQGFAAKRRDRRAACELAEQRVTELYGDLLAAVKGLLPAVGAEHSKQEFASAGAAASAAAGACAGRAYGVLRLRGRLAAVCEEEGSAAESREEPALAAQLESLRASGAEGRARDALCAALAALASRREMCWLEAHDGETPERGYFAHALACPRSTLQLSVASRVPRVQPASLLVTSRFSLRKALERMDYGGPLRDVPAEAWAGGQLEFALQELEDSDDLGKYGSLPEERQPALGLPPDARLRELLLSQVEVVMVAAYAALAPRAVAAAEALSEVVQAEFEHLLRSVKAEGAAVVLQLGGDNPHKLARKVYSRLAFAKHGLRCGYLRWRPSPQVAWAREQPWARRVCIGLQLP